MQARPHPRKYRQKLARRQPQTPGPHGLELRPYQILMRPLVTEKGTHQSNRYNAFAFQVNIVATKDEIKAAVEQMFNVRVEKVRTAIRPGKKKRFRQKMGETQSWKRALVTLHPEDKIDFF